MSRSNKHRIIWIMFVVIFLYMPETEIFKQFNCLQNNIFCDLSLKLLNLFENNLIATINTYELHSFSNSEFRILNFPKFRLEKKARQLY